MSARDEAIAAIIDDINEAGNDDAYMIAPPELARIIGKAYDAGVEAGKPKRRTAAPVIVFAPNTGDPALDEWMRAHWRPADAVAAAKRRELPKPSKLSAKMTNAERDRVHYFNAYAIKAWRDRGHEVTIEPLPGGIYDVALDGRNVRVLSLGVTS